MNKFISGNNSNEEIVEIIIRDCTGAKIDTFKCKVSNYCKIERIIKNKYGLYNKSKDLEWLN